MRLTTTGLGIGTSTVSYALSLRKDPSSSSTQMLQIDPSTRSNSAYLQFNNNGSGTFNIGRADSAGGFAGPTISAYDSFIWNTGVQNILFGTNNTERMRLDSSGNLGLGVTPKAWAGGYLGFQIRDAAFAAYSSGFTWVGNNWYSDGANKYIANGYGTLYEQTAGKHVFYNAGNNTSGAGAAMTLTQAMTLDASGNLLVGNTSGTGYRLNVKAAFTTGVGGAYVEAGEFNQPIMVLNHTNASVSANLFQVQKSGTGVMTLDSSGNLLVGTTSATTSADNRLSVVGTRGSEIKSTGGATAATETLWNNATTGDNVFVSFRTETSDTQRGTISYNRAGGLVAYNTTCDYRAKDISGPLTNSGALIDSVPVYMGKMKGATQERPMFIAHETPAYAHTGEKDAVDVDGNPVYQQMDASALIPVMWAEIQSLRARVAALES